MDICFLDNDNRDRIISGNRSNSDNRINPIEDRNRINPIELFNNNHNLNSTFNNNNNNKLEDDDKDNVAKCLQNNPVNNVTIIDDDKDDDEKFALKILQALESGLETSTSTTTTTPTTSLSSLDQIKPKSEPDILESDKNNVRLTKYYADGSGQGETEHDPLGLSEAVPGYYIFYNYNEAGQESTQDPAGQLDPTSSYAYYYHQIDETPIDSQSMQQYSNNSSMNQDNSQDTNTGNNNSVPYWASNQQQQHYQVQYNQQQQQQCHSNNDQFQQGQMLSDLYNPNAAFAYYQDSHPQYSIYSDQNCPSMRQSPISSTSTCSSTDSQQTTNPYDQLYRQSLQECHQLHHQASQTNSIGSYSNSTSTSTSANKNKNKISHSGSAASATTSSGTNPSAIRKAYGTFTATGEKIRRPPNAFMIFAKERRREILYSNQTITNKDVSKQLGIEWRQLTDQTRARYQLLSEELRHEHQIKYPGYYYSPVEARKRKEEKKLNRKMTSSTMANSASASSSSTNSPNNNNNPSHNSPKNQKAGLLQSQDHNHNHNPNPTATSQYNSMPLPPPRAQLPRVNNLQQNNNCYFYHNNNDHHNPNPNMPTINNQFK